MDLGLENGLLWYWALKVFFPGVSQKESFDDLLKNLMEKIWQFFFCIFCLWLISKEESFWFDYLENSCFKALSVYDRNDENINFNTFFSTKKLNHFLWFSLWTLKFFWIKFEKKKIWNHKKTKFSLHWGRIFSKQKNQESSYLRKPQRYKNFSRVFWQKKI